MIVPSAHDGVARRESALGALVRSPTSLSCRTCGNHGGIKLRLHRRKPHPVADFRKQTRIGSNRKRFWLIVNSGVQRIDLRVETTPQRYKNFFDAHLRGSARVRLGNSLVLPFRKTTRRSDPSWGSRLSAVLSYVATLAWSVHRQCFDCQITRLRRQLSPRERYLATLHAQSIH